MLLQPGKVKKVGWFFEVLENQLFKTKYDIAVMRLERG